MPAAIHQLLAGYTERDAISNEARRLRTIFRGWGAPSAIFAAPGHISRQLRADAEDIARLSPAPDDVLFLHLSVGSPVNRRFRDLPGRKVILYHNVTPPEYFRGVNPALAAELAEGREQARTLAGAADLVLADSRFNAAELEALGHRDVRVFPLVLDFDELTRRIHAPTRHAYRDGFVNIVFVGRCAPNKAIDDALRVFAAFQQAFTPRSRFIQVGSWAGTELYRDLLIALSRELGLRQVELLGSQPQDRLNAVYAAADVFLCLSEHEGFCIPLLEAMAHDVPVLAYAAGAVAETLDGAGVLLHTRHPGVIAAMIRRLTADPTLRHPVLAAQRARLARFQARNPDAELRTLLRPREGRGVTSSHFTFGLRSPDSG